MGLGVADHGTAFGLGCGEGLSWDLQPLISLVYIPMTPEHLGSWDCICAGVHTCVHVWGCACVHGWSRCQCVYLWGRRRGSLSAEVLQLR